MKATDLRFFVKRISIVIILFLSINNLWAEEVKIAFIADAHFHDVYAEFEDQSYTGLPNTISGNRATIRTMQSQLMSTRLFNENYFALLATLDDLVKRNVKYVGLVGDFSDDGQPIHLRKLRRLFDTYTAKHGIRFFAVHGNHDPGRPHNNGGGKKDFLGKEGKEQKIFSKESTNCIPSDNTNDELSQICTDEITELGYEGIMDFVGHYGFMPQKEYHYWSTPYSSYNYEDYTYEKAQSEADLASRTYEICKQGTGGEHKKNNYSNCLQVVDASYVVEPIEGVWLLAIDANIYTPKEEIDSLNLLSAQNYDGSGNAGYNKMITHKQHVIEWISKIVKEAEKKGKKLITFSHFPMVDFYDKASTQIEEIFGKGKLELKRMPTEETSKLLAQTGVNLHFAGHMHYNDIGVRTYEGGEFLVNIQVPSLAAYVPGYKILTIKEHNLFEVETVEMADVPRFNELFEHYREEYDFLQQTKSPNIWDKDILESKNYLQFTDWHLTELTRNRFLPQWPSDLQTILKSMNGIDFLTYSLLKEKLNISDIIELKKQNSPANINADKVEKWKNAGILSVKIAEANDQTIDDLASWSGFDLAVDFYRLMNADGLALRYIPRERLKAYQLILQNLENNPNHNSTERDICYYLKRLLTCMNKFSDSEPNVNVLINTTKKEIYNWEMK